MIRYFAYGSNLHPVRLKERVSSARLMGASELQGYRLVFHKKGTDGSGKCSLLKTGSATESVHGALYELDVAHKPALDQFESRGSGYMDSLIRLSHEGRQYNCFTYFAQQSHIDESLKPYHWYKSLVLLGAQYLRFPDSYVSRVERIDSVEDPNRERRNANRELINEILNYR